MASPLVLVLRDTLLDELPHQRRGEGLVGGKANGALGRGVRRELLLERLRDVGAHEEAAVILERSVAHQHAVVLEHRDPVADDLGRLGRGGLDRLAQLLENGPGGGWHRPEVGVHRGEFLLHAMSILRKRSTASLSPKSSSSNSWRTSISPSLPSRAGLGKRRAHSIASSLDFTWMSV